MKLNLFAIGFYPPRNLTGAEKSGWILAKSLAKRGHALTIFTEDFNQLESPKIRRIKIIKVKTKRTLDVSPNDYALAKPLWHQEGSGGDIYCIPFITTIRKEMEGHKPDAILVNWGVPFTSFILPIAERAGIPVITILHGSDVHALTQREFKNVRNAVIRSYKKADAKIVVADYLKGILHGMGVTNVETIRNAIDATMFSPISHSQAAQERARLNIPRNATVFIHVSNLRPVKDSLRIVDAAEIALQKAEEIHFIIVGDGPLRSEMEKLAREKHIDGKFTFTGKVQAKGVRKYLSVSQAHVMSSKREGTPLVILEAFAAGKPTIASNVGGIPEILRHGYNGFLYEQGNTREFAEQILRMTDPEIRKTLSRGATQSSREHSINKLVRRYEEVIRAAINNKKQNQTQKNPSSKKRTKTTMRKFKIAFVLDSFPALSETYILNQITGLLDHGHEVDIYASGARDDPKVHAEFKTYDLSKRTYYPEKPFIESFPDLKTCLLVHVDGVQNSLTVSRYLNFFKEYGKGALPIRTLSLLQKSLKNISYDIIHCHFGPNGNLAGMLRQLGVIKGKVVTTFHGYDIRRGLKHGPAFYTPIREGVDCILSISKYTRSHLERFSFHPNKIVDHPVGIDLEKFPFRWDNENSPQTKKRPVKVLTVARLVREKGLEYGIKCIHQLLKKDPNLKIQYTIVGEGELREHLNEMVIKLGLSNVVKLLGGQHQAGVSKEMQNAHLFLFPSLAEALPVALMEAQAVGLPIVSTDVGGVSEIVADEKSGFLVSSQNFIALASKLEYLIKHPELWPEMGRCGREIVEERFNIKKLNKQLVKIFENLLAEDKVILEEIKGY